MRRSSRQTDRQAVNQSVDGGGAGETGENLTKKKKRQKSRVGAKSRSGVVLQLAMGGSYV